MPRKPAPPHPPKRKHFKWRKPDLAVPQILGWADEFFQHTGRWPKVLSGKIGLTGETWCAVDSALTLGIRGLSGGRSLAKLLALHRGVRNRGDLPNLTEKQIIDWAKAHFQKTGAWPEIRSGEIRGHPGETWSTVNAALMKGSRGLSGPSSLSTLLAAAGLKRHPVWPPTLTINTILKWANAFRVRHGAWPTNKSGSIDESPEDTWIAVDVSLKLGKRGLPGGTSLAKLLGKPLRTPNRKVLPDLKETQIIRWARAHFKRTGKWPKCKDGPIYNVPGETWSAIEQALIRGRRGLPSGASLNKLMAKHGLTRNRQDQPPITVQQIWLFRDLSGCWR